MLQTYVRLLAIGTSLQRQRVDFTLYLLSLPLCGLMVSRYRRERAICAHFAGKGLHLPSSKQLSRENFRLSPAFHPCGEPHISEERTTRVTYAYKGQGKAP